MPTPKGDPGSLLSRMVRFVRQPASGWDGADEPAEPESGYSRQVLKEIIERKRRNDFVRRREFDMLRKLRRAEPAGAHDVAARRSFFQSSMPSRPDDRATTLRKIDEIEAQMSQQWWRTRHAGITRPVDLGPSTTLPQPPGRSARMSLPVEPWDTRSLAEADSLMPDTHAPTAGLSTSFSASKALAVDVAEIAHDPEVEEAAIRFANGDDAGAEAALRAMLAPGGSRERHEETWLALFDLYRATGAQPAFEEAALEFADRFGRSAPQWIPLLPLPQEAPIAPAVAGLMAWICPPVLGAAAVADLAARTAGNPPPWRLDWSALTRLEPSALQPLAQLFAHWAAQPVQIRLVGARALERVLAQATPSGDRSVPPGWWKLRLEALRLLHRPDEFELAALDYCVTYEMSPPSWERPRCQLVADPMAREEGGSTQFSGPGWPESGLLATASGFGGPTVGLQALPHAELAGAVRGDPGMLLESIEARLADAPVLVISCARLARIDFEAAGTLLNWATARGAEGRAVHLVDVHRLVAAFFHVIGISTQARVGVRRD